MIVSEELTILHSLLQVRDCDKQNFWLNKRCIIDR